MHHILKISRHHLPVIAFFIVVPGFCSAESDELSKILAKIRTGEYAGDASMLVNIKEKAGPAIEILAEDPDPEVRRRAVECLCDMDYNVETNIFKQFSFPKMGNFDRAAYFQMLYPRRTPAAKNFLLGIYKNAGPAMRSAAINCLSAYNDDKEIADILTKDFSISAGEEKAELGIALARIGVSGTRDLFLGMLRSKDAMIRNNALFSLGILGGEDSAKAAAGMLSDKDPGVRAMAMRVLGHTNGINFIPKLEKAARVDKVEENRYLAATVTERIKREAATPLDKRIQDIDIEGISRLDPDLNRSEYKAAVNKISNLDHVSWPQLMRKIDIEFSLLKFEGQDAMEAEGFTFLGMLRPIAMVDEKSAMDMFRSILPDRSYDTRLRLMAMDDFENAAVLRSIANDPLEPPVLRVAANSKLEKTAVTHK